MGDVHVIYAAYFLCGSHEFQTNFQLSVTEGCVLCRKFLVSLKSPDMHSLLVAVILLSH
jgi:hypothetical protein